MKKINLKKGFTLIELLVVVAIIGILASVVLASLNSARSKGSDAAIKANLANIRAQAAMYYDTNNKYNTSSGTAVTCSVATNGDQTPSPCTALFGDATVLAALKAAASASGAAAIGNTNTAGDAWAASATLKATADGNFCVDSTGAAKKNSTATAGVCS